MCSLRVRKQNIAEMKFSYCRINFKKIWSIPETAAIFNLK